MSLDYEGMRLDKANWKLGVIYYCPQDPRLVVRNRFAIGWAWNFGNFKTVPAIVLTVAVFFLPTLTALWLGVTSKIALGLLLLFTLTLIMIWANHHSRDPNE